MMGVGAMVVKEDDEVLVVRERFYKHPHWKLPGGYVEPGGRFLIACAKNGLIMFSGILLN